MSKTPKEIAQTIANIKDTSIKDQVAFLVEKYKDLGQNIILRSEGNLITILDADDEEMEFERFEVPIAAEEQKTVREQNTPDASVQEEPAPEIAAPEAIIPEAAQDNFLYGSREQNALSELDEEESSESDDEEEINADEDALLQVVSDLVNEQPDLFSGEDNLNLKTLSDLIVFTMQEDTTEVELSSLLKPLDSTLQKRLIEIFTILQNGNKDQTINGGLVAKIIAEFWSMLKENNLINSMQTILARFREYESEENIEEEIQEHKVQDEIVQAKIRPPFRSPGHAIIGPGPARSAAEIEAEIQKRREQKLKEIEADQPAFLKGIQQVKPKDRSAQIAEIEKRRNANFQQQFNPAIEPSKVTPKPSAMPIMPKPDLQSNQNQSPNPLKTEAALKPKVEENTESTIQKLQHELQQAAQKIRILEARINIHEGIAQNKIAEQSDEKNQKVILSKQSMLRTKPLSLEQEKFISIVQSLKNANKAYIDSYLINNLDEGNFFKANTKQKHKHAIKRDTELQKLINKISALEPSDQNSLDDLEKNFKHRLKYYKAKDYEDSGFFSRKGRVYTMLNEAESVFKKQILKPKK